MAYPNKGETFQAGTPNVKDAVKEYRKQQEAAGHSGSDLQGLVKAYKDQQLQARNENMAGQLPEGTKQFVRKPAGFYRQLLNGRGPAFKRLMFLQAAGDTLGYKDTQKNLEGEYGRQFDALKQEDPMQAGSKVEVERDFQESPTFSAFQGYVGRHINPDTGEAMGLTPGEENTIRGAGRDAAYESQQEAMQGEESRLAAAGIDPRSGVAAGRAMEIRHGTQHQLGDLERSIVDENLKRKQQFEDYAAGLGNAEEGRRQFDVSGDLRRLGDIESGEAGLAGLSERQRQYDTSYTESQRQAKKAREAAAKAAKELEPSTLEQVGSGLSGLMSGLGGGGGGGGGGMGGMMGGK